MWLEGVGRWGKNNNNNNNNLQLQIPRLLPDFVLQQKDDSVQFFICVMLEIMWEPRFLLKIKIKIKIWHAPDCHHKVFVMVKPGRLLPPTLSVQDVPGRAGGGAPLQQSLNFWLHL